MIYIKACVVWIGLLLAIAALGAVREALLTPLFGELPKATMPIATRANTMPSAIPSNGKTT